MKIIQVNLGNRSYPIQVKSGLMQEFPAILKKNNHGQKWVIISQNNLMELFGFKLMDHFRKLDFDIDYLTLPNSEAAKSINEFNKVINQMIKMNCDRSTIILALGGGVVGDVAGFVASSFMRGINYYQIPTTLLAMVDSAIGGKTGINFTEGKNLVGAIYQPKGVLIDPKFLNTLPKEELISGLSEVIKYGAIWDREFFDQVSQWLDEFDSFPFEKAVHRSCEIKAEIVSEDEREDGLRKILNFGHTIGHAVEAHLEYRGIRHGEAVALGMKCAGWISREIGTIDKDDEDYLIQTIEKLSLDSIPKLDTNTILSFVKRDKKVKNSILHFVILDKIGFAKISKSITYDLIKKSLKVIQ